MKKILIALFAVALLTGCECFKDADKASACKKGSTCCVKAKAAGTTCKALKASKCKMKMQCKAGCKCAKCKAKAAAKTTSCSAVKSSCSK